MLTHSVDPFYPQAAKSGGVQGAVVMFAVIGSDGAVKDMHVLDGHPWLVPAAMAAVKQWRYRPYVLNGRAVEFQTTITEHFSLSPY